MNQADMLYRCRRCHHTFHSDEPAPNGTEELCKATRGDYTPHRLLELHACADGHIGIADLVGCEFTRKNDAHG